MQRPRQSTDPSAQGSGRGGPVRSPWGSCATLRINAVGCADSRRRRSVPNVRTMIRQFQAKSNNGMCCTLGG